MGLEEERKSINVLSCVEFVVPWLVWPVALATLLVLGFKWYRGKKFIEALPLLMT